jgi:hypothetical protein
VKRWWLCFRPFIEHLALGALSPKTVRQHVDNLWSLGGEIIRDLHYDPSLRKKPADRLLRNAIHEDGGPLVHNGSEEAAALLRRHLPQTPPLPHPTARLTPSVTHEFPGRGELPRLLTLPGQRLFGTDRAQERNRNLCHFGAKRKGEELCLSWLRIDDKS